MLRIWYSPVSTKELLLKISVPKMQAKSLKSTCEVVSFYYICKLYTWNLLRTIFLQAFRKDFAEITCNSTWIVKNLIFYFAEASQYFFHCQFTTFLPFSYHVFGAIFSAEHLTVVSANTYLKVTSKKLKWFPEIIYKCRKCHINSL